MSLKQTNYKAEWIKILQRLEPTIHRAKFITWFNNSAILKKDQESVDIGFSSDYSVNWVSTHYDVKILQAVQEVFGPEIKKVNYIFSDNLNKPELGLGINLSKDLGHEKNVKKVRKVRKLNEVTIKKAGVGMSIVSGMLNQRYGLSNFVSGKENSLPHAACQAVVNMPGSMYNPLYIYGDVGLGKTHLIQGIGNEVLRTNPNLLVKYITAERFVTEVVEAIGKRYMNKFKQQYRNVDVFLIDDIQFFARKNSSQQEFFHTFNELYDLNKQIVLTSDRPPNELDDLDERLKSRFGMGMVLEVLPPEYETRVAILQKKAQEFEVLVDPDVLQFVAQNVEKNVRELEGVLRQILAESQLFDRVPTIATAAEIIKRMNKAKEIVGYDIERKAGKKVVNSSEEVIDIVANFYNLSIDDITGKRRNKEVMLPRQICMYLIKTELGFSYETIGSEFNGRNHTTVMHACNKTADRLKDDLKIVREINSIKKEMGL